MTTASADRELATQLRVVFARGSRRLRQEAAKTLDLSPTLSIALATLDRGGPLTPSELAARERIARPTASRLITRLEQRGLVERAPDPADRRSCIVSVTGAGRTLLAEARERKDAFLEDRLASLDPADRALVARAADVLELMLDGDARS